MAWSFITIIANTINECTACAQDTECEYTACPEAVYTECPEAEYTECPETTECPEITECPEAEPCAPTDSTTNTTSAEHAHTVRTHPSVQEPQGRVSRPGQTAAQQ